MKNDSQVKNYLHNYTLINLTTCNSLTGYEYTSYAYINNEVKEAHKAFMKENGFEFLIDGSSYVNEMEIVNMKKNFEDNYDGIVIDDILLGKHSINAFPCAHFRRRKGEHITLSELEDKFIMLVSKAYAY